MKLLYLSCHEVLEYDELCLFAELGIEVLPLGAYLRPDRPAGTQLRAPIPNLTVNPEDVAAYEALSQDGVDPRTQLTADFLRRFDAVIVMHIPEWVEACVATDSQVPVIWRTIGQSSEEIESRMQLLRRRGLHIVRYSPREECLRNYCGSDALIRFGKETTCFPKWQGGTCRVVTFAQHMQDRGRHCGYDVFRTIVAPFACDLYGPGNETTPDIGRGPLTFEQQFHVLRDSRVFVSTGTYPASYTLGFMEAWLAGTPVVAIGRNLWEIEANRSGELYEVPDLLTHGVNGFVSDSISELQAAIGRLLQNETFAQEISVNARSAAQQYFGRDVIRGQWAGFLETL